MKMASRWSEGVLVWMWILISLSLGEEGEGEKNTPLGNPLQNLGHFLNSGGDRVWVDRDVELKSGTLLQYHFFAHPMSSDALSMRLQVWTPLHDEEDKTPTYRLKWEKSVTVDQFDKLYEIILTADERTEVDKHDKIGFTSDQEVVPISYRLDPQYGTWFYKYRSLPSVGDEFQFDPFVFPAQFAIGAVIGKDPAKRHLEYCGNEIEVSSKFRTTKRSWLDQNVNLVSGLVKTIKFYAAPTQSTQSVVNVQVWMHVGDDDRDPAFQLLWEREVVVTQKGQTVEVAVPPEESVYVNSSCKLGWTFTGTDGPIAYKFDGTHTTISYAINSDDDVPVLGGIYKFDPIGLPHRFMVGLWIDKEYILATQPTTTTTTIQPELSTASDPNQPEERGSISRASVLCYFVGSIYYSMCISVTILCSRLFWH